MANDADGLSWTESQPANTDARNEGAQEIRGLRKGTNLRLGKEHTTLAVMGSGPDLATGGGEHIAGSAVSYRQSGDPTKRPDAATDLTAADDGRLWVDSDDEKLYSYVHPSFVAIAPSVIDADAQSTDIKTAFLGVSGWTNATGFLVLVSINLRNTSSSTILLQVEDISNQFRTIGVTLPQVGGGMILVASVMVPNGNSIKLASVVGSWVGEVRYSHIVMT